MAVGTNGGTEGIGKEARMITVMGATGNTGRKIAEGLLASGHQVRALGRSAAKLAGLEALGAEPLVGDTSDAGFLARALDGASAVYTLLPTDRQAADYADRQREEGEANFRAIRETGVRRVVQLSCIGAELSEGNGLIAGLHAQEERLKALSGASLYFLHPASFFENFYHSLDVIRHEGIVADSFEANLAIPMVASRDIAAAAVKALSDRH